MTLRIAILRFALAAAALFVLAAPTTAHAHPGHAGAHAPASSVKQMVNPAALAEMVSEAAEEFAGAVLSAFHPDHHDCVERGCQIGNCGNACGGLVISAHPSWLLAPRHAQRPPADERSLPGLAVPYDGPPPKLFA